MVEGETYFVGKDVASALGYKNTKDALMRHIDEEDKLTSRIDMAGQNRQVIIINEKRTLLAYPLVEAGKRQKIKTMGHRRSPSGVVSTNC